jgi:hypothetical protein
MQRWCDDEGISRDPNVGYHPEGIGVAERNNRSVLEKGNSIRIEAG